MEQIRISAKNLGLLALPNFCPRCFWIRLHNKNQLPYQIFPGVFASIDSYSKKITNLYFDKQECLPNWFNRFGILGKPTKLPGSRKFSVVDAETNIRLTGVPDDIFLHENGSCFIVDYKTARFSSRHDELYPMYDVQLNAYAYIAEATSYGPVAGLGLVYYEPRTNITLEDIGVIVQDDGFSMDFRAKLLSVDLNPDSIRQLLRRTRQIYDLAKAPEQDKDCRNCSILNEILRFMV